MKICTTFRDKTPFYGDGIERLTIEGKDCGLEIVEQLDGGFLITVVTSISSRIVVEPIASNQIIVKSRSR